MTRPVALLWFRIGDLRLADNAALHAALADHAIVPFFAWTPGADGEWAPGGASRWWLHHSLSQLAQALERRGSRLILRAGPSVADVVAELAAQTGATHLFYNLGAQPGERSAEASLTSIPHLSCSAWHSHLLIDPATVLKGDGGFFQVFSPFWRAAQAHLKTTPVPPPPARLPAPEHWPASALLAELQLLPVPDWAGGLRATWRPGEAGAAQALQHFLDGPLARYDTRRNLPGEDGTSRLSPYLHFGELGPRQLWSAVDALLNQAPHHAAVHRAATTLRREVGWREFASYLLYHQPGLPDRSLDPTFDSISWRSSRSELRAWQQGRTGYPLVDAGMRQLWQTGWLHNRVRMVVASFLVKDLLQPWQTGAHWFWDTLVDADLGNNTLGWQWAAGAGADAAPFPRVFNPTLQAEKFDPHGIYIRRYVPELAALPDQYLRTPWTAPPLSLAEAGVELGKTYPWPIVDHADARQRALAAFGARTLSASASRT